MNLIGTVVLAHEVVAAVTQGNTYGVIGFRTEQIRHIVAVIEYGLPVVGRGRSQYKVTNPLSVDETFVDTQAADVEGGLFYCFV